MLYIKIIKWAKPAPTASRYRLEGCHLSRFNNIRGETLDQRGDQVPFSQPVFRDFLVQFGVSSGDMVLDLGAGTGRMTGHLMKLVGEGRFSDDSDKIDNSLKFVLGLRSVDMIIIGFENSGQIGDYSQRMNAVLTEMKNASMP